MMIRRIRKIAKYIVMPTFLAFIVESILPLSSYALTSGPSSPEFSSFEPVATTNMVNEFTGDFTYNLPVLNIPGPDGGGYAMSLSYHSGLNAEQEASWVGFGWTLNPGAINRGTRGFPDDFNGAKVKYYNKVVPNWTAIATKSASFEPFGLDIPIELAETKRFNNYKGFSKTFGFGINVKNYASLQLNSDPLSTTFTFQALSLPLKLVTKLDKNSKNDREFNLKKSIVRYVGPYSNLISFNNESKPLSIPKYSGYAMNFSTSGQVNPLFFPVGVQGLGLMGNLNVQIPKKKSEENAYGYMYNFQAPSNNKIGDYFVEKENIYSKQDLFIGMPFNNADNFVATAEGMGGGFRMYHTKTKKNLFVPELRSGNDSKTTITQGGLELAGGLDFGVGLDLGYGTQKFLSKSINNYMGSLDGSGNKVVFRFNNDLGGKVEYSTSSGGISSTDANFGYSVYSDVNGNGEINNSTYIDYETDNTNNDKIKSFEITTSYGGKYKYGQPVFNKKEYHLAYGLDNGHIVQNNSMLYQASNLGDVIDNQNNTHNMAKTVSGQSIEESYASAYLLTEIVNSNYVDADGDGKPSDNDFGGWTKFDYHKKHSDYKWRVPYNGLAYNKGTISSGLDDKGSVSYGNKEVHYLKTIETKTHVAYFVTNKSVPGRYASLSSYIGNLADIVKYLTGSGKERYDGLSAIDNESTASSDPNAKGNQQLEYLEKIVLFSKSRKGKPVVVVNFKYDYSLVKGIPNSVNAGTSQNNGKLTLKKVWFEYEGVVNAKISPYEFKYEYKKNYPSNLQAQYPEATSHGAQLSSAAQNPVYSKYDLDAWGNHGYDTENLKNKLKPWVSQNPDYNQFDPAAWHLKQIKLPSGAEIHVQYEQKDYAYVQAKHAMSMMSIDHINGNRYYLKTEDIGLDPTNQQQSQDIDKLVQLLTEMKNRKEKLYFKFLYSLKDGTPSLNGGCSSEYIKGYVDIKSVGKDWGRPYIELESAGEEIPKTVCEDYVYSNRANLCNGLGLSNQTHDVSSKAFNFGGFLGKVFSLSSQLFSTGYQIPKRHELCKQINESLSYLRVPMPIAKKGGGVRVKRVLLYDKGLENGSAELYGTEYIYQQKSGESSGVATNEPMLAREENPYVNLADRIKQKFYDEIVYGEDLEKNETPIGESILPGASIGYSRIMTRNIHQGKSGTGYSISEYHTAKDYPTLGASYASDDVHGVSNDYTDLQAQTNSSRISIPLPFPVSLTYAQTNSRQGYRYVLNNMHGQMKKKAVYGGDINDPYLLSSQEYEYFEPGEKIQLYDGTSLTMDNPGKEEDITFNYKNIEDQTMDFSLEMDISVAILFIALLPYLTTMPSFSYSQSKMKLETNSKVIRYPAIVKSVKTVQEGVHDVTEYLTFDKATGQVVLAKNSDGFDGLQLKEGNGTPHKGTYYTLTIPAHYKYPDMGQKTDNPNKLNMLTQSCASVKTYNFDPRSTNFGSFQNVISAGAQTYSKNWMSSSTSITGQMNKDILGASANAASIGLGYNSTMISNSLSGLDNIYRPKAAYSFKTDIVEGKEGTDRIYNAGTYKNFTPFDFANAGNISLSASGWQKMNEITLYSPNGQSLEEKDITSVKSTAKYGYKGNTVPTLVAQNAAYDKVWFEDFESYDINSYSNSYSWIVSDAAAHTGKQSQIFSYDMPLFGGGNQVTYTKGEYWLMFWAKEGATSNQNTVDVAFGPGFNGSNIFTCTVVAKSGEWKLFRGEISTSVNTNLLVFANQSNNTITHVDDIRLQPIEASMETYVYDVETLKLIAQFDDQHFATLYQYNAEGKLVRVLKETKKGILTIKETQYNIPKEDR